MTISEFKDYMSQLFHNSDDLFFREVNTDYVQCILCYLDGGSDKIVLEQDILSPLLSAKEKVNGDNLSSHIFFGEEIKPVEMSECPSKVAEGDVILFLDGEQKGHLISIRSLTKGLLLSLQRPMC